MGLVGFLVYNAVAVAAYEGTSKYFGLNNYRNPVPPEEEEEEEEEEAHEQETTKKTQVLSRRDRCLGMINSAISSCCGMRKPKTS